jgi:hypothetical protein
MNEKVRKSAAKLAVFHLPEPYLHDEIFKNRLTPGAGAPIPFQPGCYINEIKPIFAILSAPLMACTFTGIVSAYSLPFLLKLISIIIDNQTPHEKSPI